MTSAGSRSFINACIAIWNASFVAGAVAVGVSGFEACAPGTSGGVEGGRGVGSKGVGGIPLIS